MALPLKHYEVVVTTVTERRIYISAVNPSEALFEAGRRVDQEAGREKDRYLALREVSDAEWET